MAGAKPFMARLLAQRNVQDAELFFNPKLDFVNWAELLGGIKAAAKMLLGVAQKGGTVAVIGDYDVDGAASSAMIKILCRYLNVKCHVFLPSRHEHGYGLNSKTVPAFIESVGEPPDLLIAADCGTSSEPELDKLRQFGAKKIAIVDHHIADPKRFSASADVVINWRLAGTSEMCTAGEAFVLAKVIEKFTGERLPPELLPLAAIATVADVSPIVGVNRILVKCGLAAAGRTKLPGLRLLLEKCGLSGNGLSQMDVAFKVAPRLNAVGRMNKPNPAYDLLIEEDEKKAVSLVEELESCNGERRLLLNDISTEAIAMAEGCGCKHGAMLIKQGWHVGIVGIVASRVAEHLFLPSLVLGSVDGKIKGSGRSIEGVNLKAIMDSCSELFEVYGGHEMAAGATLKPEMVDRAPKIWDEACAAYFEKNPRPESVLWYDTEISAKKVSAYTCYRLRETLYPYDKKENPEPVFLLRGVDVTGTKISNGDTWSLMTVRGRKDGQELGLSLKTFNRSLQSIQDGQTVDFLITMAQSWDERFGPSASIVDAKVTGGGHEWEKESIFDTVGQ